MKQSNNKAVYISACDNATDFVLTSIIFLSFLVYTVVIKVHFYFF